ncbi:MAG: nucleoside diphosphate kinase regulator [Bacteroidales bacterium]
MERSNITLSRLDFQRITRCIEEEKKLRTINDFEIQRLLYELTRAEITEPRKIPNNIITMNSEVEISFLENQQTIRLKIVYPNEADIKDGKISIFSPIANALLGHKIGDIIEWVVPAGGTKFKIEKILYQPEASGHFNV